jgi:anti-sigma B factor antagonist
MTTDFAVRTQTTGRAKTLTLGGELDLVSSPALQQALDDAAGSDADLIIVDLRELEFMDSTGLHALVNAQRRIEELGRRFALVRGGESVQRLFELTGVVDGLTIVDSPEELLEAHGAP